jgi:hypothetical protein
MFLVLIQFNITITKKRITVPGSAHQFSGMRKASKTKAYATIADPKAKALKNHFNKR